MCLDPFGHFKENGELAYPDTYLNDCDSMETRRQQGIPDGKSALGCKKIVETGKKDFFIVWALNINFFNNSVKSDLRI